MRTRRVSAVVLIIIMMFMLAACRHDNEKTLAGKYVIADITDDPDGVTFTEIDAMYKENGLNLEDFIYMEFSEDGQFTLIMFGEEEAYGAYTFKDNTLTLTAGGETLTADVSGEKVTWLYENGAKLVFEKK